jgi:hypothetical protein
MWGEGQWQLFSKSVKGKLAALGKPILGSGEVSGKPETEAPCVCLQNSTEVSVAGVEKGEAGEEQGRSEGLLED